MAAPDGGERRRLARATSLLLVVSALGAACASAPRQTDREPLPPRAVAPPKPEVPPSEPPVATPPKPATVVVLDPGSATDGEAAKGPQTLAEAAARERERRREAPKPVAVINDKNLATFAAGQTLTEASPAFDTGAAAATDPPTADGHDETWWRQRGLEIRQRWHDAEAAVERLEGEVAELRTRFYSTDDPYVRDSQVKPEWDRKLAELDAARRDAASGPDDVARFLEEGRRAGALPGWLREGVELEPEPIVPKVDTAEPGEPVVVGQEPPPE